MFFMRYLQRNIKAPLVASSLRSVPDSTLATLL